MASDNWAISCHLPLIRLHFIYLSCSSILTMSTVSSTLQRPIRRHAMTTGLLQGPSNGRWGCSTQGKKQHLSFLYWEGHPVFSISWRNKMAIAHWGFLYRINCDGMISFLSSHYRSLLWSRLELVDLLHYHQFLQCFWKNLKILQSNQPTYKAEGLGIKLIFKILVWNISVFMVLFQDSSLVLKIDYLSQRPCLPPCAGF